MPRYFNTTGLCIEGRHYMVPPEPRLPEARKLIEQGQFFVVHAPRQTGKSTTLRAICNALTAEGAYAAVHFSCEAGEAAADNYGDAERIVLGSLAGACSDQRLPTELRPSPHWPEAEPGLRIQVGLQAWAAACPRPLVLVFDEIDALRGESLRSVLRQLRAMHQARPAPGPHSIILCGLRDVRDYKLASGGAAPRAGSSSPFNVKVESLRVGDLVQHDVRTLYEQHTHDTGQPFTAEALARAFELTQGQPWLVNALAREVIDKIGVAPPQPITVEHIDQAKERLILARQTHLDSLVSKLHEPRVRRILEPLLAGTTVETDLTYDDDASYVRDLGLIMPGKPVQVANPLYREIIARVLSQAAEDNIAIDPRILATAEGRLDFGRLLEEFAAFWIEHGEVLARRDSFHEAAPQLVIMAFLQRVVNGGGYIDREYGVGRGRIDLLVRWPFAGPDGKRQWQREALELKVWRDGEPDPKARGLKQLDEYLGSLGLDHGTLVLFDRRKKASRIGKRTKLGRARTASGRPVVLLRG